MILLVIYSQITVTRESNSSALTTSGDNAFAGIGVRELVSRAQSIT